MKSVILLVGLMLLSLGGCTATEQGMLAVASDDVRKSATRQRAEPRQKIKSTKQPQPLRPTVMVSSSDTTLPAWSVQSPKPSDVLRSTLTPSELFAKVSPAVYELAAVGQTTQSLASQGSAVGVLSVA